MLLVDTICDITNENRDIDVLNHIAASMVSSYGLFFFCFSYFSFYRLTYLSKREFTCGGTKKC